MKCFLSLILFLFIIAYCNGQIIPEKYEEKGKYGIKYHDKIVLPAVYDSIISNPLIITIKGNQKNIYDNKMNLLHENLNILTFVLLDEYEKLQIITKNGKLFSYDDNGLISNLSKLYPNETLKLNTNSNRIGIENYTICKKDIIMVNSYENYHQFDLHYKKQGKHIRFLNNQKKLEIENLFSRKIVQDTIGELLFSEKKYFEPLKVNYIVNKINGKYGVWDFQNEKIILSYEYQKILPFHNYLLLKRENLYTFYPNIGIEPKYKKLEPYIGYFARFETVDGRKGWVDRKGKEYFDE